MLDFRFFCVFLMFLGVFQMAKQKGATIKVVGFVKKDKFPIWESVKKELESKNGQKLNDSFILNYILGSIQQDGKLMIFH